MPTPNPLVVLLLDQVTLSIADWATRSRKHYATYDGTTYRNLFPNQYITLKPTGSIVSGTDTVTLQDPGSVVGETVETDTDSTPNTMTERIIVDDSAADIPPHAWMKVRTRVEFWSGVIGTAMTMSGTTVSGNATLTVGSNALIVPGQAISGTGIPTGAIVMEVPIDSSTTVILSHQATASATVVVTLTGSDYVGGYWEDEELGDAEGVAILQ